MSHTTIHRPHHDGFNAEVPYVFAAIEIEGAQLYAQVPGAPSDGSSLIGRDVTVEFVTHGRIAAADVPADSLAKGEP